MKNKNSEQRTQVHIFPTNSPLRILLAAAGTSRGTDSKEKIIDIGSSAMCISCGILRTSIISYLHHRVHITLWTCELGWIFHLQDLALQVCFFYLRLLPLSRLWTTDSSTCYVPCWHGPERENLKILFYFDSSHTSKVTFLLSKSFLSRPQMKQVFFLISSVLCFSDLRTNNVRWFSQHFLN